MNYLSGKVSAKTKEISKLKPKPDSSPFSCIYTLSTLDLTHFRSEKKQKLKQKPLWRQVKIACGYQPNLYTRAHVPARTHANTQHTTQTHTHTEVSPFPQKAFIVNIHPDKSLRFPTAFVCCGRKQLSAAFVKNNNCRHWDTCHNVPVEIKLWEIF